MHLTGLTLLGGLCMQNKIRVTLAMLLVLAVAGRGVFFVQSCGADPITSVVCVSCKI